MAKCRILVVDDDPLIREIVSDVLVDAGYPVVTAGDGAEALDLADRLQPALVLLDMMMPHLDGWDFSRAFRERHAGQAAIVVMTAGVDAQRSAREVAAAAVIEKPFDLDDLLQIVQRVCGRRSETG